MEIVNTLDAFITIIVENSGLIACNVVLLLSKTNFLVRTIEFFIEENLLVKAK